MDDSRSLAPAPPPAVSEPPARASITVIPPGGDRELAAPVDPRAAADREIALFLGDRPADLVFFFGYGQGWHVAALRARTNAAICVYEPCPKTRELLARGELAPPADVTVVGTLAGVMSFAASRSDLRTCRLLAGAVPALRREHAEAFARFVEAVKQARADAALVGLTYDHAAATWIRHLAANLPQVATLPPLDALADTFTGHAGVLVGAGPSLDRSLEALRALQGQAVICAVSTALPALARAGVVADLVVAIEGHDLSEHFAGVPHLERMTLLPGPVGHPVHFAVPVGRRLAFAPRGCAAGQWLHRAWGCRQLPSGGSVACTGFAALHLMGCDPLVLVGMDLALTGGRTHARHTVQGDRSVHRDDDGGRARCRVDDDQGTSRHWSVTDALAWGGAESVLTRPEFNSYRLWFEGAAETWARDRVLVNATGGGARIHGFAEVTLDEWRREAQRPPVDVGAVIARTLEVTVPPDAAALWREVAAELDIIAGAAAAATAAERLAGRALKELEARRFAGLDALLSPLAAAEAKLGEMTRATLLLNTLVGERTRALAHDGTNRPDAADKVASTRWSLRQSRAISRLVIEGAQELAGLYGPLVGRPIPADAQKNSKTGLL